MRVWIFRVLAFLLALVCILLTPWAMSALPVEQKDYLKGEQSEWEGILTIGVVQSFDQSGFSSWLSARGREFEDFREGTLISIREMNVTTYKELKAAGALPDAVILGSFVEENPLDVLLPISGGGEGLRAEALEAGKVGGAQYGLPLAMGAYGLMGNLPLLDGMQIGPETEMEAIGRIFAEQGREIGCAAPSYARTDLALQSMAPQLQAYVRMGVRARAWPEFALDERTVFYVATQREVLRMRELRSAGRCFETCIFTPGESAYTDQVLYFCVTNPKYTGHGGDAAQRMKELGALAALLLGEEAQRSLSDAGLFSAREGMRLYDEESMAALERSLEKELRIPSAFDPYENASI